MQADCLRCMQKDAKLINSSSCMYTHTALLNPENYILFLKRHPHFKICTQKCLGTVRTRFYIAEMFWSS